MKDDEGSRDAVADAIDACTTCGLCLADCPTYVESGMEADSPRGRVQMMRLLEQGAISGHEVPALWACLAGGDCESACPTGVRFVAAFDLVRSRFGTIGQGGDL